MPSAQSASRESTSSSLIARARDGDAVAWRQLSELFGPLVYGWARQPGLQATDAADVMQEVFRAVAANIQSYDRTQSNATFRGWLYTITRNKVRDHFRRAANRPEATGGTSARQQLEQFPDAAADASSIDQGRHFSRATQQTLELVKAEFEERTWRAFWATAVEDKPPADVADELGMKVSAVYMAKSRVLRRLRDEMNELFGEP